MIAYLPRNEFLVFANLAVYSKKIPERKYIPMDLADWHFSSEVFRAF